MTGGLAVGIACAALALAVASALVARRRVARAERRTAVLEGRVDVLAQELGATRTLAQHAGTTARRAAIAAGVEEAVPRLALEPLTGRVVKAVALGAGARRAIAHLTGFAGRRRT